MIMKLLVLGVVLYACYRVFFTSNARAKVRKKEEKRTKKDKSEEMVECPKCGVYASMNETILATDGKTYCSAKCAGI